ncbi:syntaxin-4 isoform X2 [Struthio camelus]|uniref:syntaxin-4 isoform X2 n=1 Tax=Struthio camelus TaxID=8801 RepID=UPI003604221F
MRDRTRELRQDSLSSDEDNGSDEASPEHVTLVGLRPRPAPAPPGADALEQARGVRAALRTLELKVAALERQQDTVLGTPLPDEGLKRELQTLRDEIRELTGDARARLKALEPGPEEEDENRNCLGSRVRRTQHGVLSQQLLALAARCQAAQAGYRERNVARIRRQLSIAGGGTVSEEELEQMLETGQSEVFVANALGAARATRAALDEMAARHGEILRLERSLRDLGDLFALLGTTVESQGEVIDRIERNILDSGTFVRKGQEQLGAARESQRGARRRKLLAAACLVVALVVLVAAVGAALGSG